MCNYFCVHNIYFLLKNWRADLNRQKKFIRIFKRFTRHSRDLPEARHDASFWLLQAIVHVSAPCWHQARGMGRPAGLIVIFYCIAMSLRWLH